MKFMPLFFLLVSVFASAAEYPKQWWQWVDPKTAPEWEILPQAAGPGEVILSKRTELGVFSNFAHTPFILDGVRYESVEGFWQMMKFPEGPNDPRANAGLAWPWSRQQVAQMIGFDAKHAGDIGSQNMKTMGINWVSYRGRQIPYRVDERGPHYQLIARAMWAKLTQNPNVAQLLLKTGKLRLRPDHSQGANPPPAWCYHEIWMQFRSKLQDRLRDSRPR